MKKDHSFIYYRSPKLAALTGHFYGYLLLMRYFEISDNTRDGAMSDYLLALFYFSYFL